MVSPQDAKSFNLVKACRHGQFAFNRHDRYIGRSMDLYGEFSEAEVGLLAGIVRPGWLVVEAGANVGAHTVPISRMAGPDGAVIAFEPQRLVFQLLCANLALNSIANVFAYQRALGATSGSVVVPQLNPETECNFGGLSLGQWEQGEPVPLVALDEIEFPRLDLLKLDVEGMECEVIAGAAATLARYRPVLYVENDRAENSEKLTERIASLGYQMYTHTPPLFNPHNFAGNPDNVFGEIVSGNLLCIPAESEWRPGVGPHLMMGTRSARRQPEVL